MIPFQGKQQNCRNIPAVFAWGLFQIHHKDLCDLFKNILFVITFDFVLHIMNNTHKCQYFTTCEILGKHFLLQFMVHVSKFYIHLHICKANH